MHVLLGQQLWIGRRLQESLLRIRCASVRILSTDCTARRDGGIRHGENGVAIEWKEAISTWLVYRLIPRLAVSEFLELVGWMHKEWTISCEIGVCLQDRLDWCD